MAFITKDIVTSEWVAKKAVYKIVGMETENWEMVNVKVFDWEYTKNEVIAEKSAIQTRIDWLNSKIVELDDKLTHFPI